MTKKMWSLLLTGALIAGVFTALPAQAATEVPATPNVTDLKGDANFINDSTAPGLGKGTETPADASTIGDILAGWFSADAAKVHAHIQVEAVPPGGNGISYNFYAAPGEGSAGANTVGCLRFWLVLPGTNPGGGSYQGAPIVKLHDRCNTGGNVYAAPDAEFLIEEGPDGTGIVTISAPRDLSPLFADGQTLSAPTIVSNSPAAGQTVGPRESWAVVTPSTDNTATGTDYVVGSGGGSNEPPVVSEPPAEEPKPKPVNCKKKKNKKKKECKKGEAPSGDKCAAYVPGEQGAEAESLSITDAHTAEAPLEITIEQAMGLGGPLIGGVPVPPDGTSHVIKNLQVDSKEAEAGLFIRYLFPAYEDHDLYVNYPDGSEAAHVGGFNAVSAGPFDGTGSGGHSERGAEQIDGLRTPDCGGYTVDFSNYLGEGGEYIVQMWLGEIQNDPAAPANAVE